MGGSVGGGWRGREGGEGLRILTRCLAEPTLYRKSRRHSDNVMYSVESSPVLTGSTKSSTRNYSQYRAISGFIIINELKNKKI